jgi:hypothetical protein
MVGAHAAGSLFAARDVEAGRQRNVSKGAFDLGAKSAGLRDLRQLDGGGLPLRKNAPF